jgi:hypothetical protein
MSFVQRTSRFSTRSLPLWLSCFVLAAAFAPGCSTASESDPSEADIASGSSPSLCAAVRGNGELIGAHFQSLAHIVETYGALDGMAGGSSASITTFLYESILANPAITRCGEKTCSRAEKSARIALALKSIMGYGGVVATSKEALVVRDAVSIVKKVQAEATANGALAAVTASNASELSSKLSEALSLPEVKDSVNPELFSMLKDVSHLAFNVAEIQTSIKTLGAFSVDDNRLFFRAGVLNWTAMANLFGRIGDFYAGYEPGAQAAFATWLDTYADATLGKSWEEAATVTASGTSCAEAFGTMVTAYREKARTSGAAPKRLSEKVGNGSVHKLISTAVLEGVAVKQYEAARGEYVTGKYPTGQIASFTPDFKTIQFGYWGSDADLERLQNNTKEFVDAKTAKMTSLGSETTWGEILSASPAEPGLSRFVKLSDGRYSAGGWSDLAPVLALKNIGCKRVVYVQRQGDESIFAARIAAQLGMDETTWKSLYDLSTEESGYQRSVSEADAVWCTNWNAFEITQQSELAKDAYSAPFELRGLSIRKPLRNYSSATTSPLGIAGCSAGVRGTKSWTDVRGTK